MGKFDLNNAKFELREIWITRRFQEPNLALNRGQTVYLCTSLEGGEDASLASSTLGSTGEKKSSNQNPSGGFPRHPQSPIRPKKLTEWNEGYPWCTLTLWLDHPGIKEGKDDNMLASKK